MRGFTLLEVLMYVGLYTVLIAALSVCIATLQRASSQADSAASQIETRLLHVTETNRMLHAGRN